jgi:CheY-like chemotaxis protein
MTILHFEYSGFFKRVLHDLAILQGHNYIDSDQGEALFNLLAHYDVDVILTGLELSDMSAETLISNLKASKYKHIPVVIVTSSEVENVRARLKSLPFDDFILKEQLTPETLGKCLSKISV